MRALFDFDRCEYGTIGFREPPHQSAWVFFTPDAIFDFFFFCAIENDTHMAFYVFLFTTKASHIVVLA